MPDPDDMLDDEKENVVCVDDAEDGVESVGKFFAYEAGEM